jgi:hypothetical protein
MHSFLQTKLNTPKTKTNLTEILACIPNIVELTEETVLENINKIKNIFKFTDGDKDNNSLNNFLSAYPILVTNISPDMPKIEFYFNLYLGISKTQFQEFIESFPLLVTVNVDNVLNIFRVVDNYKLDKKEWFEVVKKNPKVFLFRHSQINNIMNNLSEYKIKPKETFEFIKQYPDLLLINRHNLLIKKLELFQTLGMNKATIRNLIKTYPFILLKSYNSFINKVLYFTYELDMRIEDIDIYPIILVYNLERDIKPRCNLMKKYNKWIPFKEAFSMTPEEFAKKINISPSEFIEGDPSPLFERDLMFRYSKYYTI